MGSTSSSASDALPAGISPEEGAGCVVSGETKIHTRFGLARASSLAGQSFEVWTGVGWSSARIESVGDTPHLRVGLSDGSWLECSAAASWPVIKPGSRSTRGSPESAALKLAARGEGASPQSVKRAAPKTDSPPKLDMPSRLDAPKVDTLTKPEEKRSPPLRPLSRIPTKFVESKQSSARGLDAGSASDSDQVFRASGRIREWAPRIAAKLRPGDKIVTRPIVDPKDLLGTLVSVADAYTAGEQHGFVAQKGLELRGVAARYLAGSPEAPGLAGDALRAFVDGWAGAQGGYLVGPDAAMAELQMLLRRVGIWRTLLECSPASCSLYVAGKAAWPLAEGRKRQWVRSLRSTSQVVISLETLPKKIKTYRLVLAAGAPTVVMVGNTMLAAMPLPEPPATPRGPPVAPT